jgi:hypothetical protein
MNSNLVPELRTDKNGVSSTRWVKPAQGANDRLSGIPAPVSFKVEAKPSQELLKSAATLYVHEIEEDMADDPEYMDEALDAAISDFSDYPASIVSEIAKPTEHKFLKFWGLKLLIHDPDTSEDTDLILDFLKLSDTFSEQDYEEPEDAVRMTIAFSRLYDGVQPIPLNGEYPELRLEQMKALANGFTWVETHMYDGHIPEDSIKRVTLGKSEGLSVIADDRLSNLLIERVDQNALIVDFIRDRKSIDVDAIMEVLNTGSIALARGSL